MLTPHYRNKNWVLITFLLFLSLHGYKMQKYLSKGVCMGNDCHDGNAYCQ